MIRVLWLWANMYSDASNKYKVLSRLLICVKGVAPGGTIATKVGYFGSNLLKCPRGRWAPNLLKSVAWPPVC